MAVAGKVAITLSTENGGAWSADVTYDRLVAVKHNNNLYISRKTVANVEPPNNEFWFLALEGFSGDDIEDIINGSTQVGNAKSLDGHGAEYFERLGHKFTIVENLDAYGDMNNVPVFTAGIVYSKTQNTPPTITNAGYGLFYTIGHSERHKIQRVYAPNGTVTERVLSGGAWSEWKTIATTADLANYLQLYGGGTLSAPLEVILSLMAVASTNSYLQFKGKDGVIGHLGFAGLDNPVFLNATNTAMHNLLHTGNKPTGTYFGNSNTTQRQIYVGGISKIIAIYNSLLGITFVDKDGAWVIGANGAKRTSGNEISFNNGYLTLATADDSVNSSQYLYTYVSL